MREIDVYSLPINLIKGKIVDLSEGDVVIQFDSRLGMMRIPLRMLITEKYPQTGDEVELYMSYVMVNKQ
ncbi:hypothetical protein ELD05_12225 [Caldicellulosiruptor changbaiensis]|uniref:DUF3006 domain-containing protein n=1 Tax=Caldicellulosiruptor changbaiensis TaxID=1222016 RepID=A0A3T0D850_9FIRM|nr:CBO2463/CBO2479 domain-containing protein [Caldicellulosiruptor changbaiensis]AZT91317.1 hypothetical protein ELD05_12225 [Caldicellulosiruptor changbaiensis]